MTGKEGQYHRRSSWTIHPPHCTPVPATVLWFARRRQWELQKLCKTREMAQSPRRGWGSRKGPGADRFLVQIGFQPSLCGKCNGFVEGGRSRRVCRATAFRSLPQGHRFSMISACLLCSEGASLSVFPAGSQTPELIPVCPLVRVYFKTQENPQKDESMVCITGSLPLQHSFFKKASEPTKC